MLVEEQNIHKVHDSNHKISITIACRNLVNLDIIGKSDPYAILYIKPESKEKWERVGITDVEYDNLSPNFPKVFDVNYYFERNQIIKIEIFDKDDNLIKMYGYELVSEE